MTVMSFSCRCWSSSMSRTCAHGRLINDPEKIDAKNQNFIETPENQKFFMCTAGSGAYLGQVQLAHQDAVSIYHTQRTVSLVSQNTKRIKSPVRLGTDMVSSADTCDREIQEILQRTLPKKSNGVSADGIFLITYAKSKQETSPLKHQEVQFLCIRLGKWQQAWSPFPSRPKSHQACRTSHPYSHAGCCF